MKFAPLLLAPLVLVTAATGKAQPQNSSGGKSVKTLTATSLVKDEKPSWLFMLETKTQWLLLIQSSDSSAGGSLNAIGSNPDSATPAGFGVSNSSSKGTNGAAQTNAGQGTSSKTGKDDVIVIDKNKTTFVFEGNTNDMPLLPPLTNPGKSPSAPDT